ncbi:MAG TPA: TIGR01777 family oxidoreductase [Chthoniobacteraceae bacterium]|nr:TIGR01777 family oxidoreductase [Chthoniobacteraceae bacterium]
MRKIIIAGGSGQIGSLLTQTFIKNGDDVVILSRRPHPLRAGRVVEWDGRNPGPWVEELEGADVVINLAGRSVNCRYTPENRREILASRVDSTRAIGEAIAACQRPPQLWLQAGTATIYAHRFDAPNDEKTGQFDADDADLPEKWRFTNEVARSWEAAVEEVGPLPETRTVILRTSLVLSATPGGVFEVLLNLVRCGLGGKNGDGRQYVSWIHQDDFVRAVEWLIDRDGFSGPVNLAAPHPVPNEEFMRVLREAWGTRTGLPATEWMLEIGALFLRTETELILKSRRVTPGRLLENGFEFEFPTWPEAANDLCARWRKFRFRATE